MYRRVTGSWLKTSLILQKTRIVKAEECLGREMEDTKEELEKISKAIEEERLVSADIGTTMGIFEVMDEACGD